MPIGDGRVFLDEVIFQLARHGFTNILLLAGHLHEQVTARYDGALFWGARVETIVEKTPAGTGGALVHGKDRLAPTFLLANGDTLFDVNLRKIDAALARHSDALAALALRRVPDVGRYGEVETRDGRIVAFREKNEIAKGRPGLINGGVGVFRKDILPFIRSLPCSIESEVYPAVAQAGLLLGEEMTGYFIDMGLPETLEQARAELPRRRRRPALFLDRDGVLNHDSGYTHQPSDLRWIDGAIETIQRANNMGVLVIVVTNQAGVAHGYYTMEDVDTFHDAMSRSLGQHGAHIDAFYACPFHPEAIIPSWRSENHPDRKPNPGMLLKALEDWPIDRDASAMIGDRESDVEAAHRVGIKGFLFRGGDLRTVSSGLLDNIEESTRSARRN